MGEATEFVGSRNILSLLDEFGMSKELVVFEGLSGFHIDDGVSKVTVPHTYAGGNAVIGDGYRWMTYVWSCTVSWKFTLGARG